jgi:hypothetical protein
MFPRATLTSSAQSVPLIRRSQADGSGSLALPEPTAFVTRQAQAVDTSMGHIGIRCVLRDV